MIHLFGDLCHETISVVGGIIKLGDRVSVSRCASHFNRNYIFKIKNNNTAPQNPCSW